MILNEFRLEGKVAIVTGAGRGLGRSMALALAEAGARVALAARTEDELASTAREVAALGRESLALPTDVTRSEQVEGLIHETISTLGGLDILINNAGLGLEKALLDTDDDELDRLLATNLKGPFFCCRAAGRHFIERRRGKVVNVVSGLGGKGYPDSGAFCASKGGLIQFTRALAQEWAAFNVQVNAVAPGWMEHHGAAPSGRTIDDILLKYIPLRRRGRAEDITGAVIYLSSESSDYITGETIFVDGGIMAHV
jgi:NAD(P)-dependent dehydrogenase (short-subunit alcohol dehydrogenase family)